MNKLITQDKNKLNFIKEAILLFEGTHNRAETIIFNESIGGLQVLLHKDFTSLPWVKIEDNHPHGLRDITWNEYYELFKTITKEHKLKFKYVPFFNFDGENHVMWIRAEDLVGTSYPLVKQLYIVKINN